MGFWGVLILNLGSMLREVVEKYNKCPNFAMSTMGRWEEAQQLLNSCNLNALSCSGGHSILSIHWIRCRALRLWVKERKSLAKFNWRKSKGRVRKIRRGKEL